MCIRDRGFLDHESLKADKIKPELAVLFANVKPAAGGSLVVHGWGMAADLVKLGKRRALSLSLINI